MTSTALPVNMRDSLAPAIAAGIRGMGLSAKALARRIAADPRAVEAWRNQECLPRAEHLLALARECPAIRAELLRRMGA